MMPERMENQSAVTDFLKTIGSDKIQAPLLRLVTGGQISFIIRVNPEFDPAAIDTLKANTLDTIKKLESMKGVYVECNYPPRLIE